MTQEEIIAILQEHKPKTSAEFKTTVGLGLRKIGEGRYRTVYKVVGHPLVVKFPIGRDGKEHSRYEYRAWKRIVYAKRKYIRLKRYMPEILHFDSPTGVMVAKYYQVLSKSKLKPFRSMICFLIQDVVELAWDNNTESGCPDIHSYNLGIEVTKAGKHVEHRLKIIDMGYFFE